MASSNHGDRAVSSEILIKSVIIILCEVCISKTLPHIILVTLIHVLTYFSWLPGEVSSEIKISVVDLVRLRFQ